MLASQKGGKHVINRTRSGTHVNDDIADLCFSLSS